MAVSERALTIEVSPEAGTVSALLQRPRGADALYVLAHGAGAGMRHRFMDAIADLLHARGIATLRYQFPYTERGGKRPDPQPRLLQTVRAALATGAKAMPGVPLVAGGKSMGGRMTSLVAAKDRDDALAGLIYLGFPLHAPGKDGIERAAHLPDVAVPQLFVQGTRDKLANLALMNEVVRGVGKTATMFVVEGGDHSFAVPRAKRDGTSTSPDDVLAGIADACRQFVTSL